MRTAVYLLVFLITSACRKATDAGPRDCLTGLYRLSYQETLRNQHTGEESSSSGHTQLHIQKGDELGELTLITHSDTLKGVASETGFDIPRQASSVWINGTRYPFEATGSGLVNGTTLRLTYQRQGLYSGQPLLLLFDATGNR